MAKLVINGGNSASGTRIADMTAADVFEFSGSTKDNNGLCVRVADSKAGKARFVNLENGKLLTASKGDRGEPVTASVEY